MDQNWATTGNIFSYTGSPRIKILQKGFFTHAAHLHIIITIIISTTIITITNYYCRRKQWKNGRFVQWRCWWHRTGRWHPSRHCRLHRWSRMPSSVHTSPRDHCQTPRSYKGPTCTSRPALVAAPASAATSSSSSSSSSVLLLLLSSL